MDKNYTKFNNNLMPWQVTGFTDGEGSFVYSKDNTGKGSTGQKFSLEFKVTQKTHSEGILYELKEWVWKCSY